MLAGVRLEIPWEVCVPPTPIRSEPWPETPTLGWDLGTAHTAQGEFVETSLDLEGPSLAAPGADPQAVLPALPLSPAPGTAGQAPAEGCPPAAGDPVGNLAEEAAEASAITSAFSLCPDTG